MLIGIWWINTSRALGIVTILNWHRISFSVQVLQAAIMGDSVLHKKWSICKRNSRVGAPDWIVPKWSDFFNIPWMSSIFVNCIHIFKSQTYRTNLNLLSDKPVYFERIHQPFCLTCNRENRGSFESNLSSCFPSCHNLFPCASQMLHSCWLYPIFKQAMEKVLF